MTDIAKNITAFRKLLPSAVKIIAVSKTKPADDILAAYNTGHRYFGENRVQELLSKAELLPVDIEWHLIGHLQSNKVKYIVPFIGMIESVDSFKLLNKINDEAKKHNRVIECLLQIFIATEETKFGFDTEELELMLSSEDFRKMGNVRICGVMGMASFTGDTTVVRSEFISLRECFNRLKEKYFSGNIEFKEISMGMSGDYKIAVEEGSTIVRVGSLIFGGRQ